MPLTLTPPLRPPHGEEPQALPHRRENHRRHYPARPRGPRLTTNHRVGPGTWAQPPLSDQVDRRGWPERPAPPRVGRHQAHYRCRSTGRRSGH